MAESLPELIAVLKAHRVTFEEGLSDNEILAMEAAIGTSLPPDLKEFYQLAFPISNPPGGGGFPAWRTDPEGTAKERRQFIEEFFEFDIEHGYWHEDFGNKPADLAEAQHQGIAHLRTLPPLIGLYSHRFMPSSPSAAGNPVISFHGPHDTVYYGTDLHDYLMEEFVLGHSNERRATKQWPKIPKWDGLFFDAWRNWKP